MNGTNTSFHDWGACILQVGLVMSAVTDQPDPCTWVTHGILGSMGNSFAWVPMTSTHKYLVIHKPNLVKTDTWILKDPQLWVTWLMTLSHEYTHKVPWQWVTWSCDQTYLQVTYWQHCWINDLIPSPWSLLQEKREWHEGNVHNKSHRIHTM